MDYRIAKIPKGGGKFRSIYIVSKDDKIKLRAVLPYLEERLLTLDIHNTNYAFQKGKNCALNALQHVGFRYTLSLDLHDFFDSVTKKHVNGLIDDEVIDMCFIDGAPRQGLPTSPIIATIAFLECDARIHRALKKMGISAVYTRYADDLIFSLNSERDIVKIRIVVNQIVEKCGYKLNERKQSIQDSHNGRTIITGISIDNSGLHATRRTKKKLRAAIHQNNYLSTKGLLEWSKCKLPNSIL